MATRRTPRALASARVGARASARARGWVRARRASFCRQWRQSPTVGRVDARASDGDDGGEDDGDVVDDGGAIARRRARARRARR